MIVWINGAFGSGKTTTGTLVAERDPRLRRFNPEVVGSLVEQYWVELIAGLDTLGHEVLHVVLEADADVMRTRIERDELDPGARDWRLQHLELYEAAREWMTGRAGLVLDTSALAPEAAAAEVWGAVGPRLP